MNAPLLTELAHPASTIGYPSRHASTRDLVGVVAPRDSLLVLLVVLGDDLGVVVQHLRVELPPRELFLILLDGGDGPRRRRRPHGHRPRLAPRSFPPPSPSRLSSPRTPLAPLSRRTSGTRTCARSPLARRVVALGVVREHRLREKSSSRSRAASVPAGPTSRFGLCEPQIGGRRQGRRRRRGRSRHHRRSRRRHRSPLLPSDRRRQRDRPHRASAPADRPRGRSISSSSTNTPSTGRRRWSDRLGV